MISNRQERVHCTHTAALLLALISIGTRARKDFFSFLAAAASLLEFELHEDAQTALKRVTCDAFGIHPTSMKVFKDIL